MAIATLLAGVCLCTVAFTSTVAPTTVET
jgi:hypothetical protein